MGFGGGRSGGGGGEVTEQVYVPAVALFEHPVPATALFEAVNGGAAGLNVRLGEPLEYGLDVNNWAITGHQRDQGTPDTPGQYPQLTSAPFAHARYVGEFTTANLPDRGAYGADVRLAYDTDRQIFVAGNQFNDWGPLSPLDNINALYRWENILGDPPAALPWSEGGDWREEIQTAGFFEYADEDAIEASLGEHIARWQSTYGGSLNVLWFDKSDGDVKTFGAVAPATAAVAASVDVPTSATGGVRITRSEEGAEGNQHQVTVAHESTLTVLVVGSLGTQTISVQAPDGSTAAQLLAALQANAVLTGRYTFAYYGTETGTTVLAASGSLSYAPFGGTHDFTGGVDEVLSVPSVPGEADEPIHIIVDRANEAIEIYYNIAAGGRLTDPDTLGPIRDYINTHLEGLTAEFVGGADADTDVTRPFANRSQFSGGSLSGLQLMLTDPIAAGAAGNAFALVARERFPGGAEVRERQAHILIYTGSSRNGGVRVEIDADIQGLNEHGAPVDISSGALGNDWEFTAVSASGGLADTITVDSANRVITYYAGLNVADVEANHILTACNRGGTGCSARAFGGYTANAHVFDGSLARINARPIQFHGGQDYHAATANPEPITVTRGPTHAHTRLYTAVDGGILLSVTNPAHDGGNGFTFDASEGDPLGVSVFPVHRRVALTIPSAGALASAILAVLNADNALEAAYFGTEDGTTNVTASRFGRHELLGGLDATEIEIQYAPEAVGGIANPDTMGDVKAVWDAGDGRISAYYGGADANTVASRHAPWEHEFEDGETLTLNLSGFALGPEQNEFTGADRAAAEAARDTYAAANPAWVESYRDATQRRQAAGGMARIWIALRWGADQTGQILRANAATPPDPQDWISQDVALRGSMGERGAMGVPGVTRPIYSLRVAIATPANVVEGAVAAFESLTGDFLVVVQPTGTAPRIRLEAPAGRVISAVYDAGYNIIADFSRQGATQVWLSDVDYDGGALMLFVRTG